MPIEISSNDLRRIVSNAGKCTELSKCDIRKCISTNTKDNIDLSKNVFVVAETLSDVKSIYPVNVIALTNNKKINVTLTSGEWTDKIQIETFGNYSIDEKILIDIKDFKQDFVVNDLSFSESYADVNKKYSKNVNATYDTDEMLEKPTNLLSQINKEDQVKFFMPASSVINAVSRALGKNVVTRFNDYQVINMSEYHPTFRDVTKQAFDWTQRVPHKQINIFQRNNTIYAIQRGCEENVIDLNIYHDKADFKFQKMRLITNCTDSTSFPINSVLSGVTHQAGPFNGTIAFGDMSVTYSNGLAVIEVHDNETTKWHYRNAPGTKTSDNVYVNDYKVTTKDGVVINETIYSYSFDTTNDENQLYQSTQIEKQYDDGALKSTKIIRNFPLGYGFFANVVSEDGETKISGISTGANAATATPYSVRKANKKNKDNQRYVTLPGRYKGDTYFPVDESTLIRIIKDIWWLNGKTQESVTVSITEFFNRPFKYEKIFDYTSRYKWRGNEYFLNQNSISITSESITQRLELVRWY